MPQKLKESFIVINGDILSCFDLKHILKYHEEEKNADATIAVRTYENTIPYGVVHSKGSKVISIEENLGTLILLTQAYMY